jgi:hypothetical protein
MQTKNFLKSLLFTTTIAIGLLPMAANSMSISEAKKACYKEQPKQNKTKIMACKKDGWNGEGCRELKSQMKSCVMSKM